MKYKRLKLKDIKKSHKVSFEKNKRKFFKKTFYNEGYNPKKGLINVDFRNKIIDGNHRHQILLEKFGEEHTIIVKKSYVPYFLCVITKLIFVIIFPLSYFGKYKRIKLKKLKQSHCVNFIKPEKKEFAKIFLNEGYIPKKELIVIGIDNKILNGNHRYCLLLQKFGENHTIIVKKVYTFYDLISFGTNLITILFLPLILLGELFKYLKNNK